MLNTAAAIALRNSVLLVVRSPWNICCQLQKEAKQHELIFGWLVGDVTNFVEHVLKRSTQRLV